MLNQDLFAPSESFESKKAKIRVIGVGGGGNAVNHMVEAGIKDVDFIAVNTDAQDLKRNLAPYRVQVGEKLTRGLGVGGEPERGRKAAEESKAQLMTLVDGCDLLFITAGMGGGTGTGVAPYLAKIAKEKYGENLLVIGVVTRPFYFEGYTREKNADAGIKEIEKYVDSLIIVPNEKLLSQVDATTFNEDAYKMADEVLLQAVQGISDVITRPGKVNIDFNDIRKVMCNSKKALVGVGVASGPDRHLIAAKKAITSPLLEDADIRGAKGFVVHFVAEENLTLFEISDVMKLIRQYANNDSVIMYGHAFDSELNGALKVTVIATGFSAEKAHAFNARRQLELEAPGEIKIKQAPEDVFADVGQKNEFEDPMMVPAIIRRKKRVN